MSPPCTSPHNTKALPPIKNPREKLKAAPYIIGAGIYIEDYNHSGGGVYGKVPPPTTEDGNVSGITAIMNDEGSTTFNKVLDPRSWLQNRSQVLASRIYNSKLGVNAALSFGVELSCKAFALSELRLGVDNTDDGALNVEFSVEDAGGREGRFMAQGYEPGYEPDFLSRGLVGFAPVDLAARERKDIGMERRYRRRRDGMMACTAQSETVD
ncbi:hypothetical protein CC86DRAFT_400701 [Ophiobolus disseminans]|uniref:Uncharacterized protein n=1 Tax=Ophiobolus disseminans TaxID=1469910 RepID=A0A6A7AGX1_9PLEO|nr:hypothetical protein CC86DRAFT_400701 [Ophiobolus disseminans]